jgi:endonuclease YncB( thermonuclease family)
VSAMSALVAVGMVCGFLIGTGATTAFAEQERVLSVGDGDTLSVREGGSRRTIRLACIDAPETAQSPYGSQARAALQAMAPVGSSVTVEGGKRDRYGRTVAEIWRGNTNVNLELVRQGDAFVYRQYLSGCDRNAYLSAEKQAESARLGVWAVPGGITRPWDWRHGGSARPRVGATPSNSSRSSGRYRCAEVGSWAKAQELLKQGHTYLDGDRDGKACEGLR